MSSWKLFTNLTFFWLVNNDPVYWRHALRPVHVATLSSLLRLGMVVQGVLIVVGIATNALLIILLPWILVWMLLLGTALAPVVVEERQHHTWSLLRMTPLPVETILFSKVKGTLWRLRYGVGALGGVLILVALGVGLGYRRALPFPFPDSTDRTANPVSVCSYTLLSAAIISMIFLADRLQQFILVLLGILRVSVSSRSIQAAVANAGLAVGGLWLFDIGLGALILALTAQHITASPIQRALALTVLGPVVGYLRDLPYWAALISAGVTLCLRECAVRVLWWHTLRAAQTR